MKTGDKLALSAIIIGFAGFVTALELVTGYTSLGIAEYYNNYPAIFIAKHTLVLDYVAIGITCIVLGCALYELWKD